MAVPCGAAGFHRGQAAHASVLLVHFAVDFHHLPGRLGASGEQPAAYHGVGEREGLYHVAALGYAAVGNGPDPELARLLRARVEGSQLRYADARHHAGGADGTRALPDFYGVRSAFREVFHARRVCDVAADNRGFGEGLAYGFYRVSDALRESVGGGHRGDVEPLVNQLADVRNYAVDVERAVGLAHERDGGSAEQAEFGVARVLLDGGALVGNPLDVAEGKEPAQLVFGVHDEELVHAEVLVEEGVGDCDRVGAKVFLGHREHVLARGHGLSHRKRCVALFDYASGQKPHELVCGVHYRKCPEPEILVRNELQNVADVHVGRDFYRVLYEPVNVVFDARDLDLLLLLRHIAVYQPEPPVERHADRHLRLGHGVHVGRYYGQRQRNLVGNRGVEARLAREYVGVLRRQRHVVVGEPESRVLREELVGV